VEAEPVGGPTYRGGSVPAPIFGGLDRLRLDETRCAREVLAEATAAIGVDDRNFIVANAVNVKFFETLASIVDQKLADVVVPIGENASADPLVVGEVKAAVVVAKRLTIQEPQALII